MRALRCASIGLLVAALVVGTWIDRALPRAPVVLGGYRVLTGDFHVHTHPLSWATLAPWDAVIEARRQGLDVIAITGHNNVLSAKVGRWFSERTGGPTVVIGQEVISLRYHLLALGIQNTIDWQQGATSAIEEVHRQGGVAVAAHPVSKFWPAYDDEAMRVLDGAEVAHPLIEARGKARQEMREFYARKKMTALGDSDFHGLGPMGRCRTYVFATDSSEQAVIEALRTGRTVVYTRDGRAFGDPELMRLAIENGLGKEMRSGSAGWERFSGACGVFGLLGMFLFGLAKRD